MKNAATETIAQLQQIIQDQKIKKGKKRGVSTNAGTSFNGESAFGGGENRMATPQPKKSLSRTGAYSPMQQVNFNVPKTG